MHEIDHKHWNDVKQQKLSILEKHDKKSKKKESKKKKSKHHRRSRSRSLTAKKEDAAQQEESEDEGGVGPQIPENYYEELRMREELELE